MLRLFCLFQVNITADRAVFSHLKIVLGHGLMNFSRIGAFITALIVIGVISYAAILGMNAVGGLITHGPGVQTQAGFIVKIDSPHAFEFKTDNGTTEQFQCIQSCLTNQPHMQRHVIEKAHTVVFFKKMPDGGLYAVNVD